MNYYLTTIYPHRYLHRVKISEHIVANFITHYLGSYHLLYEPQHSFPPGSLLVTTVHNSPRLVTAVCTARTAVHTKALALILGPPHFALPQQNFQPHLIRRISKKIWNLRHSAVHFKFDSVIRAKWRPFCE